MKMRNNDDGDKAVIWIWTDYWKTNLLLEIIIWEQERHYVLLETVIKSQEHEHAILETTIKSQAESITMVNSLSLLNTEIHLDLTLQKTKPPVMPTLRIKSSRKTFTKHMRVTLLGFWWDK